MLLTGETDPGDAPGIRRARQLAQHVRGSRPPRRRILLGAEGRGELEVEGSLGGREDGPIGADEDALHRGSPQIETQIGGDRVHAAEPTAPSPRYPA